MLRNECMEVSSNYLSSQKPQSNLCLTWKSKTEWRKATLMKVWSSWHSRTRTRTSRDTPDFLGQMSSKLKKCSDQWTKTRMASTTSERSSSILSEKTKAKSSSTWMSGNWLKRQVQLTQAPQDSRCHNKSAILKTDGWLRLEQKWSVAIKTMKMFSSTQWAPPMPRTSAIWTPFKSSLLPLMSGCQLSNATNWQNGSDFRKTTRVQWVRWPFWRMWDCQLRHWARGQQNAKLPKCSLSKTYCNVSNWFWWSAVIWRGKTRGLTKLLTSTAATEVMQACNPKISPGHSSKSVCNCKINSLTKSWVCLSTTWCRKSLVWFRSKNCIALSIWLTETPLWDKTKLKRFRRPNRLSTSSWLMLRSLLRWSIS